MEFKLEKWNELDPATGTINYIGKDFSDYFVFPIIKTRDCDFLTESNFEILSKEMLPLSKELDNEEESVFVARMNHWACGFYEILLIHESDTKALDKAKKLVKELNDYPVLDEQDYSDKQNDYVSKQWEEMTLEEKKQLCEDNEVTFNEDVSWPNDDRGYLFESLLGDA